MPTICELGLHDWKRAYLRKDSCKIRVRCSRCGAIKGQVIVIHKWEWVQRNPCVSQQVCKHCGANGQIDQKQHQWELVQRNPCVSQKVCKRCGAIGQIHEKNHKWMKIYKPNSYEIQKTCKRCGITSTNPSGFSTFIGQEEIKQSLTRMIIAADKTHEPTQHLLLCGQPGMGKVTLAKILATEVGVNFKIVSGKNIAKVKDLTDILTNLSTGDLLIIEQIESIRKQPLEELITAMADFSIDVVIGKGASARNITLKLPRLTVVGTTSHPAQLDKRLGSLMLAFTFHSYDKAEVAEIISLFVEQHKMNIGKEVINLLADLSNGCPGEAFPGLNKLLEYKSAYPGEKITPTSAATILKD